jgi:hypothetical protein
LHVWESLIVPVAIYGSKTWHLHSNLLHRLRTWELKFLRRVFRMKPRQDSSMPNGVEPRMEYNRRTARKIYSWFSIGSRKMMFQKVLESLHKAAWDEAVTVLPNKNNPLLEARVATSRFWWEHAKFWPAAKRRQQGAAFSRTGPQSFWEDPLVHVHGLSWREARDACNDRAAWYQSCKETVSTLSQQGTYLVSTWNRHA